MDGWVKLHRRLLENIELMHDDNAFLVFTKLLLMANSKGQVGKSTRDLATRLNVNHSTLYKTLKRLVEYNMIQLGNRHSYSLIQVCNWDKYQQSGKHFGKQFTTEATTSYGKQFGKRTVNTRETHGKRLTEVARIENKNKERKPDLSGSGYLKAKEIAAKIKAKV